MMDKISRLPENGTFEASEKEQADMQLTAKATNGANDDDQDLTYNVDKNMTQEEQVSEQLSYDDDELELIPFSRTLMQKKKKKGKPKAAELKKMENLSEPEYQPLDKLSPDELMDTVISTYYEPSFMQPKIETIISHHWEGIFSEVRYNWRVVLKKPDSVIIPFSDGWHFEERKAFLCQPFPKCKGMYEGVLLNTKGKVIKRITKDLPVKLQDAVKRCEEELFSMWAGKLMSATVKNLSKCGRIDDAKYYYLISGTWEEYTQYISNEGLSFENILAELKSLGLSDKNIERLKGTSWNHAYYVLNKLKNDVVPSYEELLKATKFYSNVNLLSKRDLPWLFRNEPYVMELTVFPSETASKKQTLSIDCGNFDKLTPKDRDAFKAEIEDLISNKIQEYLQKTKSKGTLKKSVS